jgi:multiple sugar transport system substrate-binding protein
MSRSPSSRFLLVLLALLVASAVSVSAQETEELQMTWWGSQARHDRTIAVIEMYEAANPGLDIVYTFNSFGDYWTRLNTEAAGGNVACLLQQDYAYLADWAERGLLLPLDEYIESGVIDTTNIDQSYLDGGTVGESIYAISLGTNSQSFIIDRGALEAAGLEMPAWDWTWADFEQLALDYHEATGKWLIGNGLEDVQLWKSLYLGHGMSPFANDGTALGYEDDQPLIDFYDMIVRLQDAGAVANREEVVSMTGAGPEQSPLVVGDAATAYQWSNQIVAVYTAAGEERDLVLHPLPRPEGGQSENYLKPSMYFSISANCPNPEEAAKFIDFFTNSLEANDVLLAERGVPISSAVREYLLPKVEPVIAATFEFIDQVSVDASPIFPPDPPGFSDFLNNVWTPLFVEPVLYGQTTAADAAPMLREEANIIFSANE